MIFLKKATKTQNYKLTAPWPPSSFFTTKVLSSLDNVTNVLKVENKLEEFRILELEKILIDHLVFKTKKTKGQKVDVEGHTSTDR